MSLMSDMEMASLEFNVKDALNVLKMYADAGRDRIQAKDLLQQCMPLIENWQERYEKLETIKENHQYCNYTEFAAWMKVSRQTAYNWKASGYIIHNGKKVDLPGTFKFWTELKWLLRW